MATINISTNDAKVIETTEEAAFAHVMKEILFKPAFDMDFGIWGVKTVWELLSLSKEDLDEYNFHDEGSKVAKLRLMEWKKIHNIHGWYFTLETPNLDSNCGIVQQQSKSLQNRIPPRLFRLDWQKTSRILSWFTRHLLRHTSEDA